ncbi:MAG: LysE family transporter [Nitrosarchaeum sp.]|nr:LysE family transporter [Nitrosarchaeum sp.]
MESILDFALVVVIVSASGVLSPGPLFTSNILFGIREGTKAGIKIAAGHAVVEFPLMVLLGIGVLSLGIFPHFRAIITVLGALVLFGFAIFQIKSILQKKEISKINQKYGTITTGIVFSALNPFFIIWWLSVGFKLISDAMLIWSLGGIIILFILHVWMDFAWLGTTSYFAKKSSKIISSKIYRLIILSLSLSLIYFGVIFLNEFLSIV